MNKTAKTAAFAISSIALAAALAACGGGGGSSSNPTGQTNSTGQTGSTASTPQPISLLAATGAAAGSPTLTGDVIADSVAYSSNMRLRLGMTALKNITQVNTAAANHALYMFDANQVGHYEVAGQPGFTGVAPSDRVAAAGYTTDTVGEIAAGIGGSFTSSTQAVDALFDAPFHRAIFLYDTTGVGFGQGPTNSDPTKYSTLVGDFVDYVQQTPDYKLVAYPYDGQTNVKPSWVANESPNPMANAPSYINQTVGYPVTLSAAGNGAFSNINFMITDASGNAVPCQETDNTLGNVRAVQAADRQRDLQSLGHGLADQHQHPDSAGLLRELVVHDRRVRSSASAPAPRRIGFGASVRFQLRGGPLHAAVNSRRVRRRGGLRSARRILARARSRASDRSASADFRCRRRMGIRVYKRPRLGPELPLHAKSCQRRQRPNKLGVRRRQKRIGDSQREREHRPFRLRELLAQRPKAELSAQRGQDVVGVLRLRQWRLEDSMRPRRESGRR
jgi:uncharacterized protein YkwD